MNTHGWPAWRHWVGRLGARRPDQGDPEAGCQRADIKDRESREMRARALECNLFVVLPDRDMMIVGADDQDPGPAAPPFSDFLRVVRDEGPADYTYLWMIDLLPADPRMFLEIVVSRPVEETFLFSFHVPQFTPFLVRIERDSVLFLSTRSSIESAFKQQQPDMTVAMQFNSGTHISELLQCYSQWDASGRPR
jgi:hypothetical protein